VLKSQMYDKKQLPLLVPVFIDNLKIWYYDSCAIEEINVFHIDRDTAGNTKKKEVTDHFAFLNFAKQSLQYYKTFSDTAKYYKSFNGFDAFSKDAGWNFNKIDSVEYSEMPAAMTDTTINQMTYRRIKFRSVKGNSEIVSIGYFLCDARNRFFTIDQVYSQRMGCPMVKCFLFPTARNHSPQSVEILFLSDSLTSQEKKVIAAWKAN